MPNRILYIITLILSMLMFVGCQSGLSVFDKTGTQYEKGLQYTKVNFLIYENETKAIINATYLNSVNSTKWDDEYQNFLIGIYISNGQEVDYTMTMNNKTYVKISQINDDNKEYEHIPLKNPWAKYYLVSFENDDNKILELKYYNTAFQNSQILNVEDTNTTLNEMVLRFEKE
ncbi:MAG: hypothetical protein KAQ94_00165 [Arcobacteraceae bacterium]|nr:hypothetical protein [Arcobacteraceae bacterium]